ncbi:UTP--glucose-1-phosphate uridylyltransferase GalU [Halobacillus sp. Marseille-P3879]|uniref:UTP--glucose-1-phosphate uridylyltransferase GalU n=1 Tax=Halobacillus sp. Marseille-P3879 TaxID=2045014 RepID=UPI000C7A97D6|nr:UTP--glucose-1-phosphate uridylyltransferase GalU [Halobacillus sp. Marseille-P3879]
MTVKKAIIPAAGLGTRFLPATKAMPKEMLPIVDKPTIQYIVEEAIASGIEDIIIVTGKGKRAIEDHFDHSFELEDNLYKKEKFELLEKVKQPGSVDIHYIRQKEPKGLGHAIWCARKFIGEEPFAVLLGDDIVESDTPCLKQLIQQYEATHASVIGVKQVPENETSRYGIISPIEQTGRRYQVDHFVEKPKQGEAPSNLAIMGRYILTPEIMELLTNQSEGAGGEIQLTDAIERLNQSQTVYGYEFEGERYDVGDQLGFIETTISMALKREDVREDVLRLIRSIVKEETTKKNE